MGNAENVRWFRDLGLTDLEQVGGKNASLGEMIANLVSAGVNVPDGFATTADAFRRFAAAIEERINADLAALDVEDVRRLAEVGREIRAAVLEQPFPARAGAGHPHGVRAAGRGRAGQFRGPVQRHRRGPAGRVVRRAAGDLSQRPRDRRGADRDQGGLRLALQRPGDRVPGASPVRARAGRVVGGCAADGPVRSGRVRRHVHHGHGVRLSRRGVHHLVVRAG